MANKNKKMTDWIRKDTHPIHPVTQQPDQVPEQAVEQEMEWEVAPDMDKNWRRMMAKSKKEEYQRVHGVKMMVSDIVTDIANRVEAVAVVGNILELQGPKRRWPA